MIIGVGCDIVEHELCRNLNWDSDPNVLKRVFSESELEIYNSKRQLKFIAGRFAAKEAILKSLGIGMQDGISLTDIQILQSDNGKPDVKIFGVIKEIADKLGLKQIHISISHSENSSIAYVIAEEKAKSSKIFM